MSDITKKDMYKVMKQFIHNECGVNRGVIDQTITDYIDARMDHIIRHKLDNISDVIINRIAAMVANEKIDWSTTWHSTTNLKTLMKDEIKRKISEMVSKKLEVTVDMKTDEQVAEEEEQRKSRSVYPARVAKKEETPK